MSRFVAQIVVRRFVIVCPKCQRPLVNGTSVHWTMDQALRLPNVIPCPTEDCGAKFVLRYDRPHYE